MVKPKPKRPKTKTGASRAKGHLRLPCLEFAQGKHKLFLLACSAATIWSVVQINRRVEDKDEGYQRALSEPRARRLARFYDEDNIVPLSILISFDSARYDADTQCLIVPNKPDAGWVIDGQHRLTGSHLAATDVMLPVVALIGLSVAEQIACFVKINKEQKGVPSSLYYELLKQLPGHKGEPEMAQERAVEIANALKTDETSPFFGRIVSTTSPARGQLSMTNFVRKVAPYVRANGRLMTIRVAPADRPKVIDNYYRALAQVFPKHFGSDESIFFKTLGFGAIMNVFPDVLDATMSKYGGFKVAHVAELLKSIDDFDFDSWSKGGTGSKAELDAADDLRLHLHGAGDGGEKHGTLEL